MDKFLEMNIYFQRKDLSTLQVNGGIYEGEPM